MIYQDNEIDFLEGTIPKQQAFVADSTGASLFTLLKFLWTFFLLLKYTPILCQDIKLRSKSSYLFWQ